jgi:hypothetical protein
LLNILVLFIYRSSHAIQLQLQKGTLKVCMSTKSLSSV